MIKTSHSRYLDNIVGIIDDSDPAENARPNTKKLFSYLKNCRQDSQGIAPLKENGKTCTDNLKKANLLNAQFQSVFKPKSPLQLKQLCQKKVQDLHDAGNNSQDMSQPPDDIRNKYPNMRNLKISVNCIIKLLQGLKPDKAPCPDQIRLLLLQKLCLEIAPILQVIFYKSLEDGSLPSEFLKANVSPIFKKGEKSDPANYRPISLTCILCKIFEHIVASNVVKHLDVNQILYDLQHGFRSKRSCETQLTMLIEEIHRNLKEGKQTDIILLAFSKAFDKVNHAKLILKLHNYGIRGRTLFWISAFLNGKSQSVVLEGGCSKEVSVASEVPQGSVLGPILFLIYHLPDMVKSQVRLFADDTAAYLAISKLADSEQLQADLDILQEWEIRWDTQFNPSKC